MLSDVLHCYLSKKGGQLSLRGGAIGGSPCLPTLMEKLIKDLGMSQIACAYGMTETSPVSLSTSVEDSIEVRCGTVGRLMPHLEMKVSKFHVADLLSYLCSRLSTLTKRVTTLLKSDKWVKFL